MYVCPRRRQVIFFPFAFHVNERPLALTEKQMLKFREENLAFSVQQSGLCPGNILLYIRTIFFRSVSSCPSNVSR